MCAVPVEYDSKPLPVITIQWLCIVGAAQHPGGVAQCKHH